MSGDTTDAVDASFGRGSKRSHEERVRDGYYIYGLVDPRALRETGDDPLLSIFYVGKGKGSRWAFHEKDVHASLVREQGRADPQDP